VKDDPRHHAVHAVREASIDSLDQELESGRDEKMADRVRALLQDAGYVGLTDRELLRQVRSLPGQSKALKDSVSPARNKLWRRFLALPTGERSFLPDLETGRPTRSTGERWVAVEHASFRQLEAARREWQKRFPLEAGEVFRVRADVAATRAAHQATCWVPVGFLERLLDYARGGVRPEQFDWRALAAGEGRPNS
jgi:hypothetical protein